MTSDDKQPIAAYQSHANPRKHEEEGVAKDAGQDQNGSGFKDEGLRPGQDTDWYGVKRPLQSAHERKVEHGADRLADAAGLKKD